MNWQAIIAPTPSMPMRDSGFEVIVTIKGEKIETDLPMKLHSATYLERMLGSDKVEHENIDSVQETETPNLIVKTQI